MSSERTAGSWTQATWRRVVGSTVVLFLVILAFLVGRVRAGADPGLARDGAQTTQQTAPPAAGSAGAAPQGSGTDPTDPFADPQADPDPGVTPRDGTGGDDDNFGNAVPDQGSSSQGVDPPSTHVS
jgi:hypothetical protein